MKVSVTLLLTALLLVTGVIDAGAQSPERIWLTAVTTTYKTRETVVVSVNASSVRQIQGFTFQIRYDPACLKAVNAISSVPGMNALPLPQIPGLADGSYASTTPQTVDGVLAQVRFEALGGCQTQLRLESAALAIRNEAGFAAPLPDVAVAPEGIALTIDRAIGEPAADSLSGAVLPLEPAAGTAQGVPGWGNVILFMLLIGALLFGVFRRLGIGTTPRSKLPTDPQMPVLQIKHGPHAGESFALDKLPCFIGRDPENEICLNDPHIINQHVKVFKAKNGYFLMDLGGETFVNGRAVRRSAAILKPGDVVRLGKSALFVFGSQPS